MVLLKKGRGKRGKGKGCGGRTPNVHIDANGCIRVHDWEELKRVSSRATCNRAGCEHSTHHEDNNH